MKPEIVQMIQKNKNNNKYNKANGIIKDKK